MSQFPISGVMNLANSQAQRRFNMWALEQQRKENDRQIAELQSIIEAESETQNKINELNRQSTDALAAAIEELTGAQDDANSFAESESKENAKFREQQLAALKKFQVLLEEVQTAVAERVDLLYEWFVGQTRSAGGPVVRPDEDSDHSGALGFPFPTGTFMLSYNSMPWGWFPCNGNELRADEFTELYTVIGNAYGTATQNGFFKLPSQSDLPTIPTHGSGGTRPAWWIRT